MQNESQFESTRVWVFPDTKDLPDEVLDIAGGDAVIAGLLVSRGIDTPQKAKSFLDETIYTPTSPMELPDVDKAVRRITQAIETKEHITIYGDYDVDGVTGTSVLLSVLKHLGADVDFYIPNRMSEGYGLNLKAVSVLASKRRTRLIITCDCGVSNFSEINFASSLGVDTLVLDHHTMPELLPPARGIVHPKLLNEDHPLYDLPGVGVAYKVCEALLADRGQPEKADELLDLVTMGMIADLVPLVRENRYLVKTGLVSLVNTKRVGLKALLDQVGRKKDTDLVGFGIAPRINAAGRLSDANKAVELMTTDDPSVAEKLAGELQTENQRRQELCEAIYNAADERVRATIDLARDKCIAIYDAEWHHGVVGIVASRLVEKYHRPVFIGQLDSQEGIVKGSARGISQIDLWQVLKDNEHLMTRWGGHKMAAGFTCEAGKADSLMRGLTETCNRMLVDKAIAGVVEIDLVVEPHQVDLDLAKRLLTLAPFGMGNRKPRLCMRSLPCSSVRALGRDGKHSRIMLANSSAAGEFECVMWRSNGRVPGRGDMVDVVFTPEVNHFNGRDRLQLVLKDWRNEFHGEEITDVSKALDLVAPIPDAAPVMVSPASRALDTISGASASELASAVEQVDIPTRSLKPATRTVWHDLRRRDNSVQVLTKAQEKLQSNLFVFGESILSKNSSLPPMNDRTALRRSKHLLIWQYPPTKDILEDLLSEVGPEYVYMVGSRDSDYDEPSGFLKRLFGLVRFAVNRKEGRIRGDKLTALMGTSKMSLALGLSVLKRVGLIDWFAEEGYINLDLMDCEALPVEDCAEFQQLAGALDDVRKFRDWCANTPIKNIQLEFVKDGVALPGTEAPAEDSEMRTGMDYDSDGTARADGIGASPEAGASGVAEEQD